MLIFVFLLLVYSLVENKVRTWSFHCLRIAVPLFLLGTNFHANALCRGAQGTVVVTLPELRKEAQAAYALASWLPDNLYSRPPDAVKALHNAGDP